MRKERNGLIWITQMDQMEREKVKSQKDLRKTSKSETILTLNKSRNPRELFKKHLRKMMLMKMVLNLLEKSLVSKQIIEEEIENTVSKIIEENTVVTVIETIKIEETIEEDTTIKKVVMTMIIKIGKIEFIKKMIKTIIIIKVIEDKIEAIIETIIETIIEDRIVIEIIMTVMITKIPGETEIIIEEIIKIDDTKTEKKRETILRRKRNDFLYEVIFKKK